MVKLARALAMLLFAVTWAPVSPSAAELDAQQRAARIDVLFSELKTAKSQTSADAATAEIWRLWMKSGRDDIDALTNQAVAFMSAGALEPALGVLDKVVAEAPQYAEGWNKRATLLYMMGEHVRSLADIEKVLELEPRHFGAIAGQGLIHIATEKWKEALAAFRRALAVHPFLRERDTIVPALERKVEGVPL